jgi:hypothetical protein
MVTAMRLFNQLLRHFPSVEFASAGEETQRRTSRQRLQLQDAVGRDVVLPLAHADSLREICNGLACCLGKLVHLGIDVAPDKSTLAYAKQHRTAELYEDLLYTALGRFRDEQGLGPRR